MTKTTGQTSFSLHINLYWYDKKVQWLIIILIVFILLIKVDIFGAMTALGFELLSEAILDWDLVIVSKIMFRMLQELNINILSSD